MKKDFIKLGSTSMVLGEKYYDKFLKPKSNKLLKVTYLDANQDEFRVMKTIQTIPSSEDYYAISEDLRFTIKKTDPFYEEIQKLMVDDKLESLQKETLTCFFIDYAGDIELFDTVKEMMLTKRSVFWKEPQDILNLTLHITKGLLFLHQKKICHLDVKLENIMIDSKRKTYKLIDFGFSMAEPFLEYVNNPKGTLGYFPKQFENTEINKYFPKIRANDFEYCHKVENIPSRYDYMLVYKIDSYCLGRTIYCLWQIFLENYDIGCCLIPKYRKNKKLIKKIDLVLAYLLENDVYVRLSIVEIYHRFWKDKKKTQI